MKKVNVLLLCCLFLLSVAFVFAGGQKATAEAGKLVLWDVQTTGVLPGILNQTADEFMKANPGIELEMVHIQNDPFKT